jgi:hypothetical protein
MVTDRSLAEKDSGKVIQPGPSGAFDTRTNACNPSVVPGAQTRVTDEHDGLATKLISPTSATRIVVVGGGVVDVVVVMESSSVVVTSGVRSATPS